VGGILVFFLSERFFCFDYFGIVVSLLSYTILSIYNIRKLISIIKIIININIMTTIIIIIIEVFTR